MIIPIEIPSKETFPGISQCRKTRASEYWLLESMVSFYNGFSSGINEITKAIIAMVVQLIKRMI